MARKNGIPVALHIPAATVVFPVVEERVIFEIPVPTDFLVPRSVQHPGKFPGLHYHPRTVVIAGCIPKPVGQEIVSPVKEDKVVGRFNRDVESERRRVNKARRKPKNDPWWRRRYDHRRGRRQ